MSISDYAVYGSDGQLNEQASTDKFLTELRSWDAKSRADLETVLNAVNAVFDANKGVRFNMAALTSYVLGQLGVLSDPTRMAEIPLVTERVQTVIKLNQGVFTSKKGKNGGTFRIADVPVENASK